MFGEALFEKPATFRSATGRASRGTIGGVLDKCVPKLVFKAIGEVWLEMIPAAVNFRRASATESAEVSATR